MLRWAVPIGIGNLEISTVTGRIVVELPDGAGADVSAKDGNGRYYN